MRIFPLSLLLAFLGCSPFAVGQKNADQLKELVSFFAGHFDSELQSSDDKNYFDIHRDVVQIWKNRKDGYWLYAEQAVSDQLNAPYRQRIHRFYQQDSILVSEVYAIPNSLRYSGAHKFKKPLDELEKDSIHLLTGCEIYFRYDSGKFIGRTHDRTCAGEIQGAAYATSELEVTPSQVTIWDRGFNKQGERVWGVAKGPYIFLRKGSSMVRKVKTEIPSPLPPVTLPQKFHPGDIKLLVSFLSGHFENELQSSQDTNYFDIHRDVARIWKKRKDGYWLYVEQSVSDQLNAPYSQRIHHFYRQDSVLVGEVYTIPNALRFSGAYKFKKPLAELHRDSIHLLTGCEFYFGYDSGRFIGRTRDRACAGEIQGAAYATSELEVTASQLEIWDQGFNDGGERLWGAAKGPYVFRRTGPIRRVKRERPPPPLPPNFPPADTKLLVSFLSGHFVSQNQSLDQKMYFDSRLDVVPIWKTKKNYYWMYAEQAVADQSAVSYRQSVFRVYRMGSLFIREIYAISNPLPFEGARKLKKRLANLRKDSIQLVSGCDVYFRYDSGKFVGSTNRLTCPTEIPGSSYATLTVELTEAQMTSVEHGFDEGGEPVLGLVKGPYIFRKSKQGKPSFARDGFHKEDD